MNWWYNFVNIKSLKFTPIPKNNLNKKLESSELDKKELNNNINNIIVIENKTRFVVFLGVITLFGIGVLYYFYSDFSGGGKTPPVDSQADNPYIDITDNQNRKGRYAPRSKVNRYSDNTFNFYRNLYNDTSDTNLDKYNVLDSLNSERPLSPTGSNDSNKTITDYGFKKGFLKRRPNS
jgi:hypothetical protein